MDKIFKMALDAAFAIVFAVFIANMVPVLACSDGKNVVTGAACSIDEINNVVKNKKEPPGKTMKEAKIERNLRPVSLTGRGIKAEEIDVVCPGGPCLYKLLQYD